MLLLLLDKLSMLLIILSPTTGLTTATVRSVNWFSNWARSKFTCRQLHHGVHERPSTAVSRGDDCVLPNAELCDHGRSSNPSYTRCRHYSAARRHGPAPVKQTHSDKSRLSYNKQGDWQLQYCISCTYYKLFILNFCIGFQMFSSQSDFPSMHTITAVIITWLKVGDIT